MTDSTLLVELIRTDKRRREHTVWHNWMTTAGELANRFYDEWGEDDPFAYGETASVGFLATAAARAGFLALPEFAVPKTHPVDGRKRSRGRSDLWLYWQGQDWWFEMKQHFIARGSDRDLERKWEAAIACAEQVSMHGVAVAGLIVSFAWLKREHPARLAIAREAIDRFAKQRQFAWRIANDDLMPESYIFLDIVK